MMVSSQHHHLVVATHPSLHVAHTLVEAMVEATVEANLKALISVAINLFHVANFAQL
jgi:hypothetical protein